MSLKAMEMRTYSKKILETKVLLGTIKLFFKLYPATLLLWTLTWRLLRDCIQQGGSLRTAKIESRPVSSLDNLKIICVLAFISWGHYN